MSTESSEASYPFAPPLAGNSPRSAKFVAKPANFCTSPLVLVSSNEKLRRTPTLWSGQSAVHDGSMVKSPAADFAKDGVFNEPTRRAGKAFSSSLARRTDGGIRGDGGRFRLLK